MESPSLSQTPIMSSPPMMFPNMMNTTPIPPLIPTSMSMGLPFIYPPTSLLHSGLLGPQGMPLLPQLPPLPQSPQSPQIHHQIHHSIYDWPPEKHSSEVTDSNNSKTATTEPTPLDLSSNKSNSPFNHFEPKISLLTQHLIQLPQLLQQNKDKIQTESNEETEQEEQLLQQSRDSPHLQQQLPQAQQQQEPQQEQQQSRAQRRKGRASKLNVNRICMKMNDEMNEESPKKDEMDDESPEKDEMNESPKKDCVNDESSNETCESLHEESEVDHIITKINNATSLLQEILLDMYSLKNDAKPFN